MSGHEHWYESVKHTENFQVKILYEMIAFNKCTASKKILTSNLKVFATD